MAKAAKYTVRESAKDWRGAEYRVGTRVYYPRMSGRSCELTEAEVVEIRDREIYSWRDDSQTEMIVVLRPLRSSRFRHGVIAGIVSTWSKPAETVTISITDNITVIDSKVKPIVPFTKDSVISWRSNWHGRDEGWPREEWYQESALLHVPTGIEVYMTTGLNERTDDPLIQELALLVPDKKK